jgi:DNA repair protein RecN (Recombination protein N)
MLKAIHIKDFAIIENLSLELSDGMTVVTGETGAGKSIVIDALDIALGDKAQADVIRHHATKCEISIEFDIRRIPKAKTWLETHDLIHEDTCIIRRVLPREGRTRNYINGTPVTIADLQTLGNLLVHIHGQHQHQALMKTNEQRELLDDYAGHDKRLSELKNTYYRYKKVEKTLEEYLQHLSAHESQKILLEYQLNELNALNLQDNELEQLHHEHKQLSHMETLLEGCQTALNVIHEHENTNAISLLNSAKQTIETIQHFDTRLQNAAELLKNAAIHLEEAKDEIHDYLMQVELNPSKLHTIEQRLSEIHQLARKYKISPEHLSDHQQTLKAQFENIHLSHDKIAELEKEKKALYEEYLKIAHTLRRKRQEKAKHLSQIISENMQHLGMEGGIFSIQFLETEPSPYGIDKIEFYVSTNIGQPMQALSKVVSGGELSRISLALQLITSQRQETPTLIFDEVDVGIGGQTAAIVGQLLRQLSKSAQVLCITHLAQVASQGHHHLKIAKTSLNGQTHSAVRFLNQDERIEEIARMLGGIKITQQTLAHAEEMLYQES